MRISDWSSDVCSCDLLGRHTGGIRFQGFRPSCRRLHSLDRTHNGQRIARQSVVQVNARVLFVFRASLAPLPAILGNHLVANAFNDLVQFIDALVARSEEHTSELQSLMRISYAVFCLKKKKKHINDTQSYWINKTYNNH